jgi:hypothetical protein
MKVYEKKIPVTVTACPPHATSESGHSGGFFYSFRYRPACYLTVRKKFRVELTTTEFYKIFQYVSEGLNQYKQIIRPI